jgi:hypothetical protein
MNSLSEKPHTRSSGAILRKRITAVLAVILGALALSMYVYYRSAYLRSAGEWRWFWVGEAIVAVWLVSVVVQILRKTPNI